MVAPPFIPECITPNCLAHGNEGEATPTTTVGFFVLSYMVETRQTYSQPEISFNYLSKRGFGWSHLDVGGGGDGDDGEEDGGGLLDFCENKNPISYLQF